MCNILLLTKSGFLFFQLHVVHYNSDKYKSFSEAKDKPGGLAVLAFFYEVCELLCLCFVSPRSSHEQHSVSEEMTGCSAVGSLEKYL